MRYLVFKKKNDLSNKPDWYDPVYTKHIYQTREFDLAIIKYNELYEELKSDEVLFLAADFGISKEKKMFQITYTNIRKNYFPFFIIKCSNDAYFNYEETFEAFDTKIIIIQNGIHQSFYDPVKAFGKYDYYVKYRIDSVIAIEYTDKNNITHTVPIAGVKDILFGEFEKHINLLGFKPMPNHHRVGPFWIKDNKRVEE